jgi:hypothetical protein
VRNWRNINDAASLARVTDEEIAMWRASISANEASALAAYNAEVERYTQLRETVERLYPGGHAARGAVYGVKPIRPNLTDTDALARFIGRVAEERQREKVKADAAALHARAIVFLHQRGKTPGVDYDVAKAAEVARAIVCEELIAKRVAAEVTFDCHCEDCHTWDGEGNRCECGDVRCCWEHGGTFEDPSVYVVGY